MISHKYRNPPCQVTFVSELHDITRPKVVDSTEFDRVVAQVEEVKRGRRDTDTIAAKNIEQEEAEPISDCTS